MRVSDALVFFTALRARITLPPEMPGDLTEVTERLRSCPMAASSISRLAAGQRRCQGRTRGLAWTPDRVTAGRSLTSWRTIDRTASARNEESHAAADERPGHTVLVVEQDRGHLSAETLSTWARVRAHVGRSLRSYDEQGHAHDFATAAICA